MFPHYHNTHTISITLKEIKTRYKEIKPDTCNYFYYLLWWSHSELMQPPVWECRAQVVDPGSRIMMKINLDGN